MIMCLYFDVSSDIKRAVLLKGDTVSFGYGFFFSPIQTFIVKSACRASEDHFCDFIRMRCVGFHPWLSFRIKNVRSADGHHDKLVRIEVSPERIGELIEGPRRRQIVDFFKGLGFTYVSLDLQGFRSGSGNEALE